MMGAEFRLEIRLLGRFSVRRGGQEIPPPELGGRLGRTLIRILVTRRGSVVPVDVLAEALWPTRQPADPAANVAVLLSRVRRALADPQLIEAASRGYVFAGGGCCRVDAEVFLSCAEVGHAHLGSGRPEAALRALQTALASWGGEPLPEDTYADWSYEYREQLLRAYLQVLEEGAQAALAVGDPFLAESLAARLVAREPLREDGHLLLIRSLAESGNQAAALSAFESLKATLAEELDIEPSREALELRQQVERGELARRPPTRRRSIRRIPAEPLAAELAFVDRDEELGLIDRVISEPGRSVAMVTGPGGAGKSRLLAEATARGHRRVLAARGFLADREEAWSIARTLISEALSLHPDAVETIPGAAARALTDLAPEIVDLRPVSDLAIDPESRRALLLEGGVRLLSAAIDGDGIIAIDDLQWADASSLDLIDQVIRRTEGAHLVLAYRPEEVPEEGVMTTFFAKLEGVAMVRRMALGPLPVGAIAELVGDEDLARTISEETDCSPLAVSEVLLRLGSEGIIEPGRRGVWRTILSGTNDRSRAAARAGQREAIRKRADRLPPRCRKMLRLLALLGREAPARLLAGALRTGERQVLDALDLLSRSDLVRVGEEGWAVGHDVIAEAVIERLKPVEQARLHGLLADALSTQGGDPAATARHLLLAGDREQAAISFARAAQENLERFAHVEAGRLAEEGMAIGPGDQSRGDLLAVRAEVRIRSGDLPRAKEDLRTLVTLKDPGPHRSKVINRMAMLVSGSDDFREASDLIELALAEAGEDARARADALTTGAIVEMNLNHLELAEARFDEALELFRRLGDAKGVAGILDGRAMAMWAAGQIRQAARAMDYVARLFMDAGELLRVGFPRASRGTLLHWMVRPQEGLTDTEQALELERTLGNADGEAFALCSRSGTLVGLGRLSEALADAEEALATARKLGHREWTTFSYWSLGQAKLAMANLAGAEAAFADGLETAENMPMWVSFSSSGMAIALSRQGELDRAQHHADVALSRGLPNALYDARLAAAEVAIGTGDPRAIELIRDAISKAEEGGHLLSVRRLAELSELL